ncbi:MAG: hypothetical protein KY461_14580 [Actinobacteria bacterium]|nr:hypothetical protein [Actinomycetota bacterium]
MPLNVPLRVPDRTQAGRVLVAIGVVGAVTSLVGTVVGFRFLGELRGALDDTIGVTADAVEALRSSVTLGGDTLLAVERILDETESTTRELSVALRDTEDALGAVAALSEDELADSLTAVSRSLPALIDVAAVIDRTLSGLGALPFGPDYDPDEPFDDSLRAVQQELAGLPASLRRQAALIRDGRDSLVDVRRGTTRMADDLATLNATLASSGALLERYDAAATDAGDVLTGSSEGLRRHLAIGRVLVVVLGTVLLASQAVPLGLGWFLLRPEAAAAFLAGRGSEGPDVAGTP